MPSWLLSTLLRWSRNEWSHLSCPAGDPVALCFQTEGRRVNHPDRSATGVASYAHISELPANALALMGAAETQHFEFGADWHANLVDSVFATEQDCEARFHVLTHAEQVLAVVPTVVRAGSEGRELSALSNFYTAIYAPCLAPGVQAEDLLPLVQSLRRTGRRVAVFRFSPMDPATPEFNVLKKALALAGLKAYDYFAFGNWYEPVTQNWAEYLAARSGQVRSTIKRNAKKFAAEGGALEIVTGGEGLDAALAAYQTVYAQSWKVPEPYPAFIPGLIKLCARRGWLRLGIARVGGKPVAAQIWIVGNGRADIYKLAYDEAYKSLAPGTLLTALLMEQAIDVDRVREIDYLIGDDSYKAAWMSKRRERRGIIAYDPLTVRGLLGFVKQTMGTVLRRLRPAAGPAAGATLTTKNAKPSPAPDHAT